MVTLGCRLNIAESETIRNLLAGRDVAVVNGCGVTNEAVKQTRAAIRRLRRDRPQAELIVTGCASDMDRDAFAAMPEVDRIVPNTAKLAPASWGQAAANMPPPRRHTRGFVAAQNGCDHRCTFCAIPLGRGAGRSDPAGEVVRAIADRVADGQREVVLSGCDLASYDDGGVRLGTLVARILAETRVERLRLSSLDPAAVDDALFAALTQEPRVMPHVHLSLQAGDDLILKRMRRRHSRADAVRLVARLKTARPAITIGADLIAGFPTETPAAFANTLAAIDDCAIAHAHVFPYSPRAGTAAARMPQVATETVRARATRLREVAAGRLAGHLSAQRGLIVPVLVERPGTSGRAPDYSAVTIDTPCPVGTIADILITGATDTHLTGTIA